MTHKFVFYNPSKTLKITTEPKASHLYVCLTSERAQENQCCI